MNLLFPPNPTMFGITFLGFHPSELHSSLCMQACSWFSGICVPIYDSLGSDAINFIIEHSDVEVVFCAASNYAPLLGGIGKIAPSKCKLKGICVWGDASVIDQNEAKV